MKKITAFIFFLLVSFSSYSQNTFTIGNESFLLNGKAHVIRCGEMHFARIPKEYWRHRLQMAKAMGLNTVCAYLFWNFQESQPGNFNWSGQADVAEFCRLAQQEGLQVVLRPGPYACAEWEMGGQPWWLLKKKDIKLRTQDAYYMERCRIYLMEVGRILAPLQITNGGPIIMVQVENEYGSYGNDKEYIGKLRDYLVAAGFNVPLFTCDGPSQLKADVRDDIFSVVNFGSNPEASFKALREIRKSGPLMCGEYYPGWFDSWGTRHHTGATPHVVNEIKYMLDHKASFSIYMAHGGTTFGQWSGANCPPYLPQTSSYDYDAPISEAGWDTPKFYELRKLFVNYLEEGETIPDVPARNKVISIPSFTTTEVAPIFNNLPDYIGDERPKNMEDYSQGFGAILYRTKLNAGAASVLNITEVHDFALVFLNGKKIATLDRRKNENSCQLPPTKKGDMLDILVDAMGRVNYGGYMHDRKGITQKVERMFSNGKNEEVISWKVYPINLNNDAVPQYLKFKKGNVSSKPAYYKATFNLNETGDTFLDVSTWGKGLVWVNGHCLGRYWNIGPTQTMYLPAPWLKRGINEVVILDYTGPTKNILKGNVLPILDRVTEKTKIKQHRKEGQTIDLTGYKPIYKGSFASGIEWQTVQFGAAKGRYFCIEALNSQKENDPFTTIAELYLLDANGKEIPRNKWKIVYADSEEINGDDGKADNIFDLQSTSFWHTQWQDASPKHPHILVIDIGATHTITAIKYLPRQESPNGRIKDFRLYLRDKIFNGL